MENVFFRIVEGKERTLVPKASIGTQLKVLHPHTQDVAGAFWEAVLSNVLLVWICGCRLQTRQGRHLLPVGGNARVDARIAD